MRHIIPLPLDVLQFPSIERPEEVEKMLHQNMREELGAILDKGWGREAKITALVNYFGSLNARPDMLTIYLAAAEEDKKQEPV